MERTEPTFTEIVDGINILPEYRGETICKPNIAYDAEHHCFTGDAVDRLAAYEATGYHPQTWQEYADAIAEDRVRVLPRGCKWGN